MAPASTGAPGRRGSGIAAASQAEGLLPSCRQTCRFPSGEAGPKSTRGLMKITRTLITAAALIAVSMGGALAKEWKKVIIGTEGAYPPFNYIDTDGKVKGFDVDIALALCEEMKVECEVVTQDWDGMIPALLANKFDAIIASMSITAERKKAIDFSEKYYNTPPAIVAPKDTDLKGVTPDDLADKTIGVQGSTMHADYVEKILTKSTLKSYPTADDYKLDLAAGRIDAANDDSVVLSEWLKTEAGACCKIVGLVKSIPEIHGVGAGIGVRKEDTDLRDMFSKAIKAIRANGKYAEINKKYFDFDVFGAEN
jgi:polar amino acid transport system substrate-binding protein